jgi:uncharacterized protein (TIGR02145 family)
MMKGVTIQKKISVKIKYFLCCSWVLFPLLIFPQGEFNNWYFGKHAGITFNSGNPTALINCAPSFAENHAPYTVSDSLGNLMFYAGLYFESQYMNGTVYNKNGQIMPNGRYLYTGWGTNQNYMAVQKLDDDSAYYLFAMDERYSPDNYPNPKGLTYSVIDMRLDGGLGDIASGQKSIQVPGTEQTAAMLSCTRHKNNHDVWLTVRKYINSNSYLTYLITGAGINAVPIVSNSLFNLAYPYNLFYASMIRFSPDGTRLACLYSDSLEYCQFNSSTGQIIPMFRIHLTGGESANAEFSIDSKYLYITTPASNSNISQYDATKTDSAQFLQSKVQIVTMSSTVTWLQRGPDNKIYSTEADKDSLAVINNPTVQGAGCNYQRNAVYLEAGNHCYDGLPQFLQKYYLYMNHSGQCQDDSVSFSFLIWPPADSLHWDFGDPASGSSNVSNLIHPKHKFETPGNYVITLITRHEDKRFDTVIQVISIKDSPQPSLGPDLTICQGDSVTFDAGACSGCSFIWSNLTMGYPNIGTGQTYETGEAGIYQVSVTNGNGCMGRDTVQLFSSPVPAVTNNPLAKSICSGESTNILLNSTAPGTVFYWTATLTSGIVTGYSSDSGLVINQTLINTSSTAGIVTYHITPELGDCQGNTVDYPVTVTIGDSVKVSITASINNICAGTPVTFIATPVNGGISPQYQWTVNGINVGTNNSIYSYNPASGDLVLCILTSSDTVCISNNPASSNTITMVVNPLVPVSVSIAPSVNPTCAGNPVTFLATPTNGGMNPLYQWIVNGINLGTNQPTFTFVPSNLDLVSCIMTSSETFCVTNNPDTSNVVAMSVIPTLPVSVNIAASNNPVCAGIPVTYTATPTNGGTLPVYQWTVNGSAVGSNSPLYTYAPVNGDNVICTLTSNIPCPSGNTATSNLITMLISPAPVVTFTACFDTITTLNAKPIKLKGGIPLGGMYSGPGVNSVMGVFTPLMAGVGIKMITYTYTNVGLCSANKSRTIQVQPIPVFACGNNLLDIRDGKAYPTIQLGGQCWFATDLNFGIQIPENSHQRDNCIPEKYINPVSGIRHPASYQWDEMMLYDNTPGLQGFCPPGWHIPTEGDWNTLFANWTNSAFAASPLKYSGYSGFNALLFGARHLTIQWDYQNFAVFYWSSDSHGPYRAWAHGMNDYDPSVSLYPSLRSNAFNIRCLKD